MFIFAALLLTFCFDADISLQLTWSPYILDWAYCLGLQPEVCDKQWHDKISTTERDGAVSS